MNRTEAWRETLTRLTGDTFTGDENDPRDVLRRWHSQPALEQAAARVLAKASALHPSVEPALLELRAALDAATSERWYAGGDLEGETERCTACGGIQHEQPPVFDVRTCVLCGCTDAHACEGGCEWAAEFEGGLVCSAPSCSPRR